MDNQPKNGASPEEDVCTPETLKSCLDYLYVEAVRAGLTLPAHLISVAAQAISEELGTGTAPGAEDRLGGVAQSQATKQRLH